MRLQAVTTYSVTIQRTKVHVTKVEHLHHLFNDYQIGCDKTAIIAAVYLKPQSIIDLTYFMYFKKALASVVTNRD